MTSWDHPRKETPDEYRARRAKIDKASAEADARFARKEREREELKYMVDSVGSSPYQRQLMMDRKAQQDRRNAPLDEEEKLPFSAAGYLVAGVPTPPVPRPGVPTPPDP